MNDRERFTALLDSFGFARLELMPGTRVRRMPELCYTLGTQGGVFVGNDAAACEFQFDLHGKFIGIEVHR